jgi:2-polyprenyl-3-methyl-5-hydroxy-6-metoxy-1,4-benzoquinol methylase
MQPNKTLISNYEEAYEKCGNIVSEQKDLEEVRFFAYLAGECKKEYESCTGTVSRPKNIIDIGCAEGQLSVELAKNGHLVTAMDISKSYVRRAMQLAGKNNLPMAGIANDIEKSVPKNMEGLYDVAYLMDVIEHLRNPSAALVNIRKILADDGNLIINTPNACYIRKFIGYMLRPAKKIDLWERGRCRGLHLQEYDYSILSQLLAFCGFRIKELITRSRLVPLFPKLGKNLLVICEKAEPLDFEAIVSEISG